MIGSITICKPLVKPCSTTVVHTTAMCSTDCSTSRCAVVHTKQCTLCASPSAAGHQALLLLL
jgi:hypothetical protein